MFSKPVIYCLSAILFYSFFLAGCAGEKPNIEMDLNSNYQHEARPHLIVVD